MFGKLKYLSLILVGLLIIPVGTIYRQNIEVWAADQGFDSIIKNGALAMSSNPWGIPLLILMLLSLGAAIGLWAEYWLRKKFPQKVKGIHETVTGRIFRHERVAIDGKYFVGCSFDGVTLVLKGDAEYGFNDCSFGPSFSVDLAEPRLHAVIGLYRLASQLGIPINLDEDRESRPPANTEAEKQQ